MNAQSVFLSLTIALLCPFASAQWVQQGNKLVGIGAGGNADQGFSVAISADGNTAIVGGPNDSSGVGAAWVFTRTGGVWSQQGNKLVGTGALGNASQGFSGSLSADGNTAIVGGYGDSGDAGAAWVFTRSGDLWSQQGNKLVGTDAVGLHIHQGISVSLSADGNTAIVGGYGDSGYVGATWVFTRSACEWSQQGNKLVGTGALGSAAQGSFVSLSSDGNTAIVGGSGDNLGVGAAWVFTRSGGVWSQQGNKLIGTGSAGRNIGQGSSVALSADGNTAIVGGGGDSNGVGAAWAFTRSGSAWSQQGKKLVGTGVLGGTAFQGSSASLSGDGNTAIVGGTDDNSSEGAAWVFTRSSGVWNQQGNKLVGTGAVGHIIYQGGSVALSTDGNTAIVGGAADSGSAGAVWVFVRNSVGVGEKAAVIPLLFGLGQNYPNPFNPITNITFQVPITSHVTLSVYDMLGREVAVLVNERQEAGVHEVKFDGSGLASGIYFYRIQAGNFVETKKLLLLR